MTILSHLEELRKRLFYVILVFIALFLVFFFFANELFHLLVAPLARALPKESALIATQISAPVLMPLNLAADAALLGTAPFALLQLWRFVAPGLYRYERFNLGSALIASLLLFCLGVLFCFYLVLPFLFQFFTKNVTEGVQLMPDMTYVLAFITRMLLIFGLSFQVPLLCLTLVQLRWVDLAVLKKIRPYVIVTAFVIGMLLTPPDVLSQLMLAVPLCLLYELGITLVKVKPIRLS